LDAFNTTQLASAGIAALARNFLTSCKLRFGQRAHLLALSAIRCSFFIAPAPLQFKSLSKKKKTEGEGFERLRLSIRLSSATAEIAALARNFLTSLQFKSLSKKKNGG